MIHELTNLKVVDNCGVKTVRVIRILGRKVAEVGTRIGGRRQTAACVGGVAVESVDCVDT